MITEQGKKIIVAAIDKYVELIAAGAKRYRNDLRTSLATHTFPEKFVEIFRAELEAQRKEDKKEAFTKQQKAQKLEAELLMSKYDFLEADELRFNTNTRLDEVNASISKYKQLKLDSANNFELGTEPDAGTLSYQEKSKNAEEHRHYFKSEMKTFEDHFEITLIPLISSLYTYDEKTKNWSYSDIATDSMKMVTTKMHWAKEYRTAEMLLKNLAAEKKQLEEQLYEAELRSPEDAEQLLGKHLEQFTEQKAKLARMYEFDNFPPEDKKYVYERLIDGLKSAFSKNKHLKEAFEVFDQEQAKRDDFEQRKQAIIKILDQKLIDFVGRSNETRRHRVNALRESITKLETNELSSAADIEKVIVQWQKYEYNDKQNDQLFRQKPGCFTLFKKAVPEQNFVDQCLAIAIPQASTVVQDDNPDDDNDHVMGGGLS